MSLRSGQHARLTPGRVRSMSFRLAKLGRRGLDEDDVREFCDQVEDELSVLLEERAALQAEVHRLRGWAQGRGEVMRQGRPRAALPPGVSPGRSSGLSPGRPQPGVSPGRPQPGVSPGRPRPALPSGASGAPGMAPARPPAGRPQPALPPGVVPLGAPVSAPAAPAASAASAAAMVPVPSRPYDAPVVPHPQPLDVNNQAIRILAKAQQTAERYVSDAHAYSREVAHEAQRRREKILAEASAKASQMLEHAHRVAVRNRLTPDSGFARPGVHRPVAPASRLTPPNGHSLPSVGRHAPSVGHYPPGPQSPVAESPAPAGQYPPDGQYPPAARPSPAAPYPRAPRHSAAAHYPPVPAPPAPAPPDVWPAPADPNPAPPAPPGGGSASTDFWSARVEAGPTPPAPAGAQPGPPDFWSAPVADFPSSAAASPPASIFAPNQGRPGHAIPSGPQPLPLPPAPLSAPAAAQADPAIYGEVAARHPGAAHRHRRDPGFTHGSRLTPPAGFPYDQPIRPRQPGPPQPQPGQPPADYSTIIDYPGPAADYRAPRVTRPESRDPAGPSNRDRDRDRDREGEYPDTNGTPRHRDYPFPF